MEKANLKILRRCETWEYLYQAIPQQYTKRFVLSKTGTFDTLLGKDERRYRTNSYGLLLDWQF